MVEPFGGTTCCADGNSDIEKNSRKGGGASCDLSANRDLEEAHQAWATSRKASIVDLHILGSAAALQHRQRHDMRGRILNDRIAPEHQAQVKLRELSGVTGMRAPSDSEFQASPAEAEPLE